MALNADHVALEEQAGNPNAAIEVEHFAPRGGDHVAQGTIHVHALLGVVLDEPIRGIAETEFFYGDLIMYGSVHFFLPGRLEHDALDPIVQGSLSKRFPIFGERR